MTSDVVERQDQFTSDAPPYLTVVFKIEDRAAFQKFYDETLRPLVHFGKPSVPYQVTGWAVDDELYRSQLFYEAKDRVSSDDLPDTLEEIYQCPNLRDWKWGDEDVE
jgi:hypothetical protein